MNRAERILRDGIQDFLDKLTNDEVYKLKRCSLTLTGSEDIVNMIKSCEYILVANLNILNFEECQTLNILYNTYKEWDYTEQFKEIDEKLSKNDKEDTEIYYDFNINKWTIKKHIGHDKREYFISFSDFCKMKEYILKELR